MTDLHVTRILQNPLGEEAPPGSQGDIVRVSDGDATIYLTPADFEQTDEAQLRFLLTQKAMRSSRGEGRR